MKFSIWFKLIPEGWKFFGAIVGFGGIIWVTAISVDHWKDEGKSIVTENLHSKQFETSQIAYNHKRDSIDFIRWDDLNKRLTLITTKQQTLTNAVGTIGSKMTNTVPELFRLMGGLQFELVQSEVMKSVFPETKIKIIKTDSSKKR